MKLKLEMRPLKTPRLGDVVLSVVWACFLGKGANYVGTETNVTGKCSIGVQWGGLGVTGSSLH